MVERREEPKVQMLCSNCGSDDVSRDAWGDWDVAQQRWVLRTVFDHAQCHACDSETRLAEVRLR
jgi:hypothetical protein